VNYITTSSHEAGTSHFNSDAVNLTDISISYHQTPAHMQPVMEKPEDEEQDEDNVDNSKSLSSRVDEEVKLEPQPAVVKAASNLNV